MTECVRNSCTVFAQLSKCDHFSVFLLLEAVCVSVCCHRLQTEFRRRLREKFHRRKYLYFLLNNNYFGLFALPVTFEEIAANFVTLSGLSTPLFERRGWLRQD